MSAEGVFMIIRAEQCRRVEANAHQLASIHQNAAIKLTILNNMHRKIERLSTNREELINSIYDATI